MEKTERLTRWIKGEKENLAVLEKEYCYLLPYSNVYQGEGIEKLAAYEDAEEAGLLVQLPCSGHEKAIDMFKADLENYEQFSKDAPSFFYKDSDDKEACMRNWKARAEFLRLIFPRTEAETALEGRHNA